MASPISKPLNTSSNVPKVKNGKGNYVLLFVIDGKENIYRGLVGITFIDSL